MCQIVFEAHRPSINVSEREENTRDQETGFRCMQEQTEKSQVGRHPESGL